MAALIEKFENSMVKELIEDALTLGAILAMVLVVLAL